MDLANQNLHFAQRFSDRSCKCAAIVVELALLGDVVRIERIGVGLILVGRAMAKHDHIAAVTQCIDQFRLLRRGLAAGGARQKRQTGKQRSPSNDASYHGILLAVLNGISTSIQRRTIAAGRHRAFAAVGPPDSRAF